MTKMPVKRYTVDGKLMTPTTCGGSMTTSSISRRSQSSRTKCVSVVENEWPEFIPKLLP